MWTIAVIFLLCLSATWNIANKTCFGILLVLLVLKDHVKLQQLMMIDKDTFIPNSFHDRETRRRLSFCSCWSSCYAQVVVVLTVSLTLASAVPPLLMLLILTNCHFNLTIMMSIWVCWSVKKWENRFRCNKINRSLLLLLSKKLVASQSSRPCWLNEWVSDVIRWGWSLNGQCWYWTGVKERRIY